MKKSRTHPRSPHGKTIAPQPIHSGTPRSEPTSQRELADLARAGYLILRQPLLQVIFEVHHVKDRPGYLFEYVKPDLPHRRNDSSEAFSETLTSSAYGLGLVIVTRSGYGADTPHQRDPSQRSCDVFNTGESRIFRGTARPNPSFIYESAWRFEGLICVDPDSARTQEWHSRAFKSIIGEISRLANDAKVPITSLQVPAQIPIDETVVNVITPNQEEDVLPSAASLAVRFAIALPRPETDKILTLTDELVRYCSENGFGLWLADTRPGSRQGNWFLVCHCDPHRMSAILSQPSEVSFVEACLPITLVGPARVGSTFSLMSFLSKYHEVGVTACSIISLDDLLFIHVQLSFIGLAKERIVAAEQRVDVSTCSGQPLSVALTRTFQEILGYDFPTGAKGASSTIGHTEDYQCLIGPSREVSHEDSRQRMALWFCWQTQGAELDLAVPLEGLFGALADVGLVDDQERNNRWPSAAPNIEYLICRNMGNSVLRGRGKLSIVKDAALHNFRANPLESGPTVLSVSIEEAWRGRTARKNRDEVRELMVAWRECWLGHWSLPL